MTGGTAGCTGGVTGVTGVTRSSVSRRPWCRPPSRPLTASQPGTSSDGTKVTDVTEVTEVTVAASHVVADEHRVAAVRRHRADPLAGSGGELAVVDRARLVLVGHGRQHRAVGVEGEPDRVPDLQ